MKMSWEFRLVHHTQDDQEWYAIHEVYTDDGGKPWSMTEDPVTFVGDSKADVIESLQRALRSSQAMNVFEVPEPGKWPGKAPNMGGE